MSHKPGMRNLPLASTTGTPFAGRILPLLPSSAIRPSRMTTVMSGFASAPVASITVTWVKTRTCVLLVLCCAGRRDEQKRMSESRAIVFIVILCDYVRGDEIFGLFGALYSHRCRQ